MISFYVTLHIHPRFLVVMTQPRTGIFFILITFFCMIMFILHIYVSVLINFYNILDNLKIL